MNNQEEKPTEFNEQTNNVDPRTINATVIGELRKDKIGRPILVLEIFGLLILVLIGLPIVTTMLDDEESALYKLVYGDQVVIPDSPIQSEFLDGSVIQPLTPSTSLKFENIVMKNFDLTEDGIKCTMYSYNDLLNLDASEYYLEVYSKSNALLSYVKLVGSYDYQEKEVTLSNTDLKFNNNYSYFGKIVKMTSTDYPKYELSTDESGIGSFACTKGSRTLEYYFKNNYLIRIKDDYKYRYADVTPDAYLKEKKIYETKSSLLPGMSSLTEVSDGFVFTADINLEQPGFKYPDGLKDYEYYKLDTEAKIVHYSLKGKGFDCK